jgi:hypothetical protein
MKDVIIIGLSCLVFWLIFTGIERDAFMTSKHKKEVKALTDSLSKANGLIKEYKRFYPSEKDGN